jgi:phosphopentomutase
MPGGLVKSFRTITLIVMDSVGLGGAPDALEYGDAGADTLGHLAEFRRLKVKNLAAIGLGNIRSFPHIEPARKPSGFYGMMTEKSKGKGSTEGHWEIAGCVTDVPFAVFPDGFPDEIIKKFSKAVGRDVIGNCPASGTEIIEQLGDEHCRTGKPIVYTSADSVFQIAACEDIVPIDDLYKWCEAARKLLTGDWNVVRVIARPFIKKSGHYTRTVNRRDFSVEPDRDTVLDLLSADIIPVAGIGKIKDLFAGRGIGVSYKTKDNDEGMKKTSEITRSIDRGLIFTNLIDFDMIYGHRNDAEGYIKALESFDVQLGGFMESLKEDQLMIITADHGCDPLFKGWDHTRERVPLLVYSPRFVQGGDLGIRETFADVGETIAENFGLPQLKTGRSFFETIS